MPPAKQHNRFASSAMTNPSDNTENSIPDNTLARPALPSGTVRARRVYPRYRKQKLRSEAQLEPAAPNPPIFKHPDLATSNTRPPDSNNDDLPSASLSQPTKTVQSTHEKTTPKSSPPQPQPQQMHTSHHHIHQQDHPPTTSQYQPMVHQHIFPIHHQPTPHFNPHLLQIPSSVQLAHLVPTQPPICVPAPQHELPFTQPHLQQIPVPLPHPSNNSTSSPQSAEPPPNQTISPPTSTHDNNITQIPTKSYPTPAPLKPAPTQQPSNSPNDCKAPSSPTELRPCAPPQDTQLHTEEDKIAKLVSSIKASIDAPRTRPLICQDITNSNADTLRISRLPRGVTYDRLLSMVEPFGEVDDLAWTASDPYVCDVTYRDASAAHEAKHFLGDALVGSDSEPPLKAELRSRDPGAQLFVGDLTPDVTEEMLEAVFSELVGEPVSALLKRDPDSFSPIGYGFLSFKNESSANFALVAGHRIKVGNACVRVGRAERNTYLYVSDLSANVTMEELKHLFGKFGTLVDEDTVIVRRSYAFVRYKNRGAAEKAKRTLDKTDLKGRLSVRYAEAEPLKACVAVQFHSSVPRPPNSLRDLLTSTFSKHGNCSVEIPRLSNGMWRKVAFVTFHGEPIAANMAALEAVQSVRFVSSLPVCCQFARELIPRLPSRGVSFEKATGSSSLKENRAETSDRPATRNFLARRNTVRRNGTSAIVSKQAHGSQQITDHCPQQSSAQVVQQNGPDFVPVYVPLSALQHPNQQLQPSGVPSSDCEFSRYHWQNQLLAPNSNPPQNINHSSHNVYNSFAGVQQRPMRW